jgi:hypothetical protein
LPRDAFLWRWFKHGGFAALLMGVSLLVGMVGYHVLGALSWLDAFLNAAMILGGMGPVATLESPAAKLFAGVYALFSGLVLLAGAGILLGPPVHRMLHRLHLDDGEDGADA